MRKTREGMLLGCVADDFTGASDAASFLVKEGIHTMLLNGIPTSMDKVEDCSAVVIALKTRNMEPQEAIKDTRAAFRWLHDLHCRQFYFKYCSTFDSRKDGNIGPTIDSLLEEYREPYTILCPALPVNGRIVKDGKLLVDGIPLDQSHMKNHPLNPMWDSEIAKLMEPQGKYACLVLPQTLLDQPPAEIKRIVAMFAREHEHFYVIPDYVTECDAEKIVEVFGDLKVLTGGSGLLSSLGRKYRREHPFRAQCWITSGTSGRGLIIAGSCSEATLNQIQEFISHGGKAYKIDPLRFVRGEATIEDVWDVIVTHPEDDILIYSSDSADKIKELQAIGQEQISALLEGLVASIGKRAYDSGIKRIIVAGGETSGAVMLGLDLDSFIIGESIAPGVPIMVPAQHQDLRLVLKSGNFGQRDFFRRALEMTQK